MQIIDHQFVLDRIGQVEGQAATKAIAIDVAGARIVEQVALITVPLFVKAGDPGQDVLGQRHVDRPFELIGAVVADPSADISTEFPRRLDRGEKHRAASRVAPEQRSLRTLEHLHGLKIVERPKSRHRRHRAGFR